MDGSFHGPVGNKRRNAKIEEEAVIEIMKSGSLDGECKWKQETALMVAARTNDTKQCEILLTSGADCNASGSTTQEQTPLWIAAYHGNLQVMELMLATGKCQQDNLGNALRQCVAMNFLLGCDVLLRAGTDVDAADSTKFTPLHIAAGNNEEFEAPTLDHWKFRNQDSWRHYHAASYDTCDLLIMWQADVNALDSTQTTALHYACETGNEDICKLLVDNGAGINAVRGDNGKTPLHVAICKDFPWLVKMLLQNPKVKPNLSDSDDDTPIMSAIQLHKEECVRIFLEDERWADFMSVIKKPCPDNPEMIDTPMRQLIRQMPDMALLVMNKCIELSSHKDPKASDFTARFNFSYLDDTYTSAQWFPTHGTPTQTSTLGRRGNLKDLLSSLHGNAPYMGARRIRPGPRKKGSTAPPCDAKVFECSNEECKLNEGATEYSNNRRIMMNNHPLVIAYNTKQSGILCHPLTIALVDHKWNKIARFSFYGGLMIYLLFVALLTEHVIQANGKRNTTNNSTEGSEQGKRRIDLISVILLCICSLGIVEEIVSLVTKGPSYLLKFGHWVDLAIYVTAIIIVTKLMTTSTMSSDIYRLSTTCVFVAWFNVLLTFRQFPVIGIFFIMFTRIVKNSLIVLLVFLPLILGFAFTFTMLMDGHKDLFASGKSIATVLVMLSGEVEFMDTMKEVGMNNSSLPLAVYILFIVLMVICLLNLLVGLAVSDVDTLHKESRAEMMSLRAQKVMSCEFYLSDLPRKWAACGCWTVKPNNSRFFVGNDISRQKILQRVKAWSRVLQFNEDRLSPAYLIKTTRVEKSDNKYDTLRRELVNYQAGSARISTPWRERVDKKVFEIPRVRVSHKNLKVANDDKKHGVSA